MNATTAIDPAETFAGAILILAPHMDDEVLACGGTVARMPHRERVHVLYATDGSRSPLPPAPWLGSPSPELAAIRMREARQALEVLGVPGEQLHFAGLPDGRLADHAEQLAGTVGVVARRIRPSWVFAPFRYDRHPDHLAVNRAATACFGAGGQGTRLVEYFVYYRWRLLRGGDVRAYIRPGHLLSVDISDVSDVKRRALERYRSQTTRFFAWQRRPNLTADLLDEVCRVPEVFAPYSPDYPGSAIFGRGVPWIRVAHRLEPVLKREKDRLVAVWRARRSR